jgi:hypothetical protein
MAENLRETIESDLQDTLEGEYGQRIYSLIGPDGIEYAYNKHFESELGTDPEQNPLKGQILYNTQEENPDTGEIVVSHQLVVTIRRTSLARIPANGERWYIRLPISPEAGAELKDYVFTPTTPLQDGIDIGFVRIYPQQGEQT